MSPDAIHRGTRRTGNWEPGTRIPRYIAILGMVLACGDSGGPGVEPLFSLRQVTDQLNAPVFLTAPPGDTLRLFVVEKNGFIRIIENGVIRPVPFLNITALTTKGSEQGLLGLAFSPDYAASGRFYVFYTTPGPTEGGTTVIARYHVSADSNVADAASDSVLLTLADPFTNHNGGMLAFGPDDMLYASLGDGGDGGDPLETGQDRTDLLASLLRLDVSGPGYTSPPDNPWAASGTDRHELWHYGLRNPWRFSFDRATSDLYIGDVGQNSREEIDVVAAGVGGLNFGWDDMEGDSCFEANPCAGNTSTRPVLDYGHSQGCSVTGGYVYRGDSIPAIQGHYFYSDYCSGFFRSFRWAAGTISDSRRWNLLLGGGVTSFGEDGRGELYVMTESGRLLQFVKP